MAEARFEGLRARWERLTERERLLFAGLAAAFVVVLIGSVIFMAGSALGELRDDNRAIREALKDIEMRRDAYLKARSKTAMFESRIGHGNVQLQGLLETAANGSDIVISETNERPSQQLKNSKYVERAVDLRIRKCTLEQLAKFLRRIETGPNLVVVTALKAAVRDDKHEDLEVELTVSTWERAQGRGGAKKAGGGGAKEGND